MLSTLLLRGSIANAVLVAAAFFLVPGYAIVTHLRCSSVAVGISLSIGLSLALTGLAAYAMASASAWYPVAAASAFAVVSLASISLSLASHLRQASGDPARKTRRLTRARANDAALQLLPLAVGCGFWIAAMTVVDIENLPDNGFPPVIPPAGFAGLALLAVGGCWVTLRAAPNKWIVGAYVTALVGCLFATIPALSEVPQYVWTYKHIGVSELINQRGGVVPDVDIYNRWPTFFALAAMYAKVVQIPVIEFAAWSEPVFTLAQACIVSAIALTVSRNTRVAGLSGFVFVTTAWTGQTYFSAQAMAFTIALGVVLVALLSLSGQWNLIRPVDFVVGKVFGQQPKYSVRPPLLDVGKPLAIFLLLLLDGALVTTHQLTPYMLILQLGAIALVGTIRPLWVVLACAALTAIYLVPHFEWVNEQYGLLDSLNPTENARVQPGLNRERPWLYGISSPLNAGILLFVAFGSSIALMRAGLARFTIPLLLLMMVPAAMLIGNSYGGEISLRVFMFGAPAMAILAVSGIVLLSKRSQLIASSALMCGSAVLFLFALTGDASQHIVSRADVSASRYFSTHAPPGSVLMLSAPNFPTRVDPRYAEMASSPSGNGPALLNEPEFTNHMLSDVDIASTAKLIDGYTETSGFLAFSDSQFDDARINMRTPPGSLEALEAAVKASPKFSLWYSNSEARIYRVTPEAAE
ncbi:MAG: hypothetical protein ACSLFF_06690 [Solirubrobacterales bacterium]